MASPAAGVRPSRSPIRLTRRGRVVVFVLCLLLGAVVAAPASQAADPARGAPWSGGGGSSAEAEVLPGDTLWSVAARHVPSRDPYRMIAEIRRLNGLSGHTIHPGQRLVLPAQP